MRSFYFPETVYIEPTTCRHWRTRRTLNDHQHSFTRDEIAPIILVSLISALRLLGIFLMLPIFSVYAVRYPGASAALAGVAFGVYALVQSVLQIPLGWASDRWGRKPVLVGGLALFVAGSIGCALATDIYGLILARALQGTGAVGSVAFAALADLTRPSVRAQAYTITGIAVGVSFMIGLLAGPFSRRADRAWRLILSARRARSAVAAARHFLLSRSARPRRNTVGARPNGCP